MKQGWQNMRRSTDRTFADKAIAVHICRGCGTWHEGSKPSACTMCGRMDYESFQSKGEARWWAKLRQREDRGEIADLERQIKIPLVVVHLVTGKPVWFADYFADFRWRDVPSGKRITAECKPGSAMTYESQLKIRAANAMGVEIEFLT